jgi:hypothetical protein
MKDGEFEELQRQGAKAAARGETSEENPMLNTCNSPSSTGEAPEVWRARARAWQTGFDAQKRAAPRSPDDEEQG